MYLILSEGVVDLMAASGRRVRVWKSSGAVWGVIASHRPANGSPALRAWKRVPFRPERSRTNNSCNREKKIV